MRKKALAIVLALVALAITPAVAVADCNDLWYERNQIFDDYGFCFKTKRGRDTFDNSDCNTSNPKLSAADRRKVKRIEAKERRQGCNGGQSNRQRPPRKAADCNDLWYERNQIFDDYGFCFKTKRGRDTFDNSDCNTSNPKLSAADRRKVKRIEAKERRQGCSGGQSNRQRPPRNKPCMDDSDCSGGYYCSINDYGTRMETRRCKKLP